MNQEKREQIVEAIRVETVEMQEQQNENYTKIVNDSRETIRNLSIVSGGIATGSLVIFSSNISISPVLIMIGIFTILLEIIFIFGYLLHVQNIAMESSLSLRRKTIYPRGKILTLYNELKEGKVTTEIFDKELIEIAKIVHGYTSEINQKILQTEKELRTDNLDLVFIGLLVFAIIFIILGICAPHVCHYWSMICV
jgi:hypothetical protein